MRGITAVRKDQLRNRQRLVAAAREAFVASGPSISLEEIARRAGVGATTLYRHFGTKDDLVEAVLDEMIRTVQENADRAARMEDPSEAFRVVFAQSCDMPSAEVVAFARLAGVSERTASHADRLVADVVRQATERLRAAGLLRAGVTVEDVAMFVRMIETTQTSQSRILATDVVLTGLLAPDPDGSPLSRSA